MPGYSKAHANEIVAYISAGVLLRVLLQCFQEFPLLFSRLVLWWLTNQTGRHLRPGKVGGHVRRLFAGSEWRKSFEKRTRSAHDHLRPLQSESHYALLEMSPAALLQQVTRVWPIDAQCLQFPVRLLQRMPDTGLAKAPNQMQSGRHLRPRRRSQVTSSWMSNLHCFLRMK